MKPEKIEKYQRRYREAVQEHLPGEEVLAIGIYYRTGSWGAMAAAEASGLAYMATRLIGKRKAGGLSQNVVLAVTPEHLYAFGYKPKGTGLKVTGQEASWDRATVQVETGARTITDRIKITGEDGSIELDTSKMGGPEFNAALVRELVPEAA